MGLFRIYALSLEVHSQESVPYYVSSIKSLYRGLSSTRLRSSRREGLVYLLHIGFSLVNRSLDMDRDLGEGVHDTLR